MRKLKFEHEQMVISTDPPYYDNIGYADLSDFFYVWLRRTLRPIFPDLYATLSTPKARSWSLPPTATAANRPPSASSWKA
jgi:adenine-specific DNA methylase